MKILPVILIILFIPAGFISQVQAEFHNLSTREGLTNLYITAIAQDADGFLWVGTQNGLFRYDGYKFKCYKKEANNINSLTDNRITALLSDSKGRLWVGTEHHLNLYNPEKENFYRIIADENKEGFIAHKLIGSIYEDKEGVIWIGHYLGFAKLTNPGAPPNQFQFENTKPQEIDRVVNWIVTICDDGKGSIWFGARYRGIYRYDKSSGKLSNYFDTETMTESFRISKIILDAEGNILIASFNKDNILKYDRQKDKVLPFIINENKLGSSYLDIMSDSKKRRWIASEKGIILSEKNKKTRFFFHDSENPNSLSSSTIQCMFEDRSGIIWLGTRGKGLDYYHEKTVESKRINAESFPEMPENIIQSMCYINNTLYFSAQLEGLFAYNNKSLRKIPLERVFFDLLYNGKSRIYSGRSYFDIDQSKTGIFNSRFKKEHNFFFDDLDNVYLQNQGYLYQFDSEGNETNRVKLILPGNKELKNNFPNYQFIGDSRFLFMNQKAVYLLVYTSGILKTVIKIEDIDNYRYEFQRFYYENGTIWIIANNALYQVDLQNGLEKTYNNNNSWGEMIFSFITDNDGDFWLSTNKGIVFYDTKKDKEYLFDFSAGINSEVFTGAIAKSPENIIYFGTGKGILAIDKKTFSPNKFVPPIAVTDFTLHSQSSDNLNNIISFKLPDVIHKTEEIKLKYYQNYFSFKFASLNFRESDKNQYAYYLDGLESDWNYAGTERKASYNGLPPGDYTFKVKASNNDGIWNDEPRTIAIIVSPPFWQTWWFRFFIVFIIALSVFIIWQIRVKSLKKRQKELEKQVRLRTAEIVAQKEEIQTQADNLKEINILLKENQEEVKAQADEIFETNTELQRLNSTKDKFFSIIAHDLKNPFQAINGFTEVLIQDYEKLDKQKTKEFIGFIRNSSKTASSLLENLLEWARSQTNRINFIPQPTKIKTLANDTFNLLKVNAEKKDIHLINAVPEGLVAFADKNMITTVLRNLTNNAIKFTNAQGSITIGGKKADGITEIYLEDTGIGMEKTTIDNLFRIDQQVTTSGTSGEPGTGLGLIITKEFIDKNNGSIKVESKVGKGSKFIIQLPAAENEVVDTQKSDKPVTDIKKESEQTTKTPEVQSTSSERKPLVLLAEDTVDIRAGIKAYLENDYKIVEAGDGEEGLKYAIDLIPDLIISDWMMPKMEGIQLCEKLKTDSRTSHIPVIMLTAKSTPTSKIQGFETGADDYITKPFDYALLKARIKNLIKSRKELQKKYAVDASKEEEQIKLTTVDQKFMDNLSQLIDKELDNSDFNINDFCENLGMSRSQLYRKITALTGQSPVNFVKNYRLKKAAQLLKESGQSVSEIMYSVGFSNTSYFARSFKEIYGCSPTGYTKK